MLLCPLHIHTSPNKTSVILTLPCFSEFAVIVYDSCMLPGDGGSDTRHLQLPLASSNMRIDQTWTEVL